MAQNRAGRGYIARWYDKYGKQRSKSGFPTKKAAKAFEDEQRGAVRKGTSVDLSEGKALFRDAAAKWLESRHDLKATTRAAYADALAPTPTDGPVAKRHKRLADLRIDDVFGGLPLNAVTRDDISNWVARMGKAGKRPGTIRNGYFLVRMVLADAVAAGRLQSNPADYVKLPTNHNTGHGAEVDDPNLFLSAAQVASLVAATPWPYNVLVHVAAWSGLRAAELAGLRVGDVLLPPKSANPNASEKPGTLRVEQTVAWVGGVSTAMPPKTKGSRRKVPLTPATTTRLREYLAAHPRRDEPTAPLFPSMSLAAEKPTGVRNPDNAPAAERQATALANLTAQEAGERLELDWAQPYRHATLYKAVYRPAVLRANRAATATGTTTAALPTALKFHALRHTYASLMIGAGRPMFEIARFMGHSKPSTTETVYAHLLADDHSDAMAALGAMEAGPHYGPNVVPLWG
jgi:integrase